MQCSLLQRSKQTLFRCQDHTEFLLMALLRIIIHVRIIIQSSLWRSNEKNKNTCLHYRTFYHKSYLETLKLLLCGMWSIWQKYLNPAPSDQQWSIRILVPPLQGLSLHVEMLNWFWHLHDDFPNFISLLFLFHCSLPVVTPSLSPGRFIHHVCFAFTIVLFPTINSSHQTTSFLPAFQVDFFLSHE